METMKFVRKCRVLSFVALTTVPLILVGCKVQRKQKTDIETSASAPKNHQSFRVGIIQMNARPFDTAFNLQQAEGLIRQAAKKGAQIVLTPEASVQGYPRVKLPPGTSMNDPKIVTERKKILAAAEKIPGPATKRFSALAQQLGIWIVFGMDENRNGKLFNTTVLMNPQGQIVGTYSKVHLQGWMVASGVQHGDGFPVWNIEINNVPVKLGIEICYDVQHPESTLELALGGAEVVFIPYATDGFSRPRQIHLFETTALENRLDIVRASYAAPTSTGTSSIIDYEGHTISQLGDRPGVLVGDIDLTAIRKIRAAWNPVYGLRNRYPAAYKRLRDCSPNTLKNLGQK
jgi:deaminated glutathione amidase